MTIELIGQSGFARALGWKPNKFTAYYGKKNLRIPLPEPHALVDGRPAWLPEQVEEYKNRLASIES